MHPFLTHFPMALLPVSLLGDVLEAWNGGGFWREFSFWCLAIGLVVSLPVFITGLIDFVSIPPGGPRERIAMRHMMVMIAAIALFAGSFFVRFGKTAPGDGILAIALALSGLGFIALLYGGWNGGELVYRYGVGGQKPDHSKDHP